MRNFVRGVVSASAGHHSGQQGCEATGVVRLVTQASQKRGPHRKQGYRTFLAQEDGGTRGELLDHHTRRFSSTEQWARAARWSRCVRTGGQGRACRKSSPAPFLQSLFQRFGWRRAAGRKESGQDRVVKPKVLLCDFADRIGS